MTCSSPRTGAIPFKQALCAEGTDERVQTRTPRRSKGALGTSGRARYHLSGRVEHSRTAVGSNCSAERASANTDARETGHHEVGLGGAPVSAHANEPLPTNYATDASTRPGCSRPTAPQ